MATSDSSRFARFVQPASFRFWAIASAAVTVLGAVGVLMPSGGSSDSHDDEPNVSFSLQGPNAKPPEPAHGEAHTDPAREPPQSVDVTNALVASDGTIVIEPALLAPGPDGPLPVVAPDGRKAMHVYAGRFNQSDTRPRVSIVLTGLGLSAQTTQAAIDRLPPGSTLAFSPYGQDLQNWIAAARAKGHEVLLELPMEPFDFPNDDPGTHTLIVGGNDNPARMNWLLGRFSGYAGVVNSQGGKFMASANDLRPVLAQIAQRGLYIAETGLSQRSVAPVVSKETQAPYAKASVQIDNVPGPDEIDAALDQLATLALERRMAIGAAVVAPGVIDRISAWAAKLDERGVAFAPVSAALPFASKTSP